MPEGTAPAEPWLHSLHDSEQQPGASLGVLCPAPEMFSKKSCLNNGHTTGYRTAPNATERNEETMMEEENSFFFIVFYVDFLN